MDRLLDREAIEIPGLQVTDLNVFNDGPGRTVVAPPKERFNLFFRSFSFNMDAAIRSVLNITPKIMQPCLLQGIIAKTDSLHPSIYANGNRSHIRVINAL